MNKLIVPAAMIALGMVAAAAWSQPSQPNSQFRPTPYFVQPLEKDPSRIVRMQSVIIPAGASNAFPYCDLRAGK